MTRDSSTQTGAQGAHVTDTTGEVNPATAHPGPLHVTTERTALTRGESLESPRTPATRAPAQEHPPTRARVRDTTRGRRKAGPVTQRDKRKRKRQADSAPARAKATVTEVEECEDGAEALHRASSGLLSVLVAIEAADPDAAERFRWSLARQLARICQGVAANVAPSGPDSRKGTSQ